MPHHIILYQIIIIIIIIFIIISYICVLCIMYYAFCIMHYALCIMYYVLCMQCNAMQWNEMTWNEMTWNEMYVCLYICILTSALCTSLLCMSSILHCEGSVSSVYLWDLEEALRCSWPMNVGAMWRLSAVLEKVACAPVQPEGYAGAFLIRKELPKIFCTILRNTLKARVRGQMLIYSEVMESQEFGMPFT